MSLILFKRYRFAVPLIIAVALMAIIGFLAQPGFHSDSTSIYGIAPPTTLPATNITRTSARLNGNIGNWVCSISAHKVFANGCDMCGYFVWGTTPDGPYPHQTSTQVLSSASNYSATISNLSPCTTYYYKAVSWFCGSAHINNHAVFAVPEVCGEQMSFTTLCNTAANPVNTGDVSPTGGMPANVTVWTISNGTLVTYANQPVTVYANVINSGDMEGGFTVNLKVNGYIEQTKMGVIAGHEAESVEFTIVKDVPGTYEIDIEGDTATLKVLAAEQGSSLSQSQTIFIVVIGLALVLIAFTAIMIMRRRTAQ